MYKTYRKNGYDVMYYRFDSISEFVDYLKNAPIQSDAFYNLSSESGSYSFTQTRSFDEAIDLIKYGYHDDFEKLVQLKLKLEKYIKMSKKRNKQFNDYIGYVPDVKAYLEGNPLSMLNKKSEIRKKINVYMNTSFYGNTSKEAIFNRGAIVLSMVEILENMGFSVDLHLFEMSTVGSMMHFSDFILKAENERMNIQKLYFPLCHPSWIRRLNFRLIEVTPDITSSWSGGYGKPSDLETMKKVIDLDKNDIIIPTIEELNVCGRNVVADANSVFDYVNRIDSKEFTLDRVEESPKVYRR
ncbi:MAG: hypothetical protein IJA30_01350 [Bacilli bacterium]|nr:hypothetical protein [Bacilli bacterium]MBQ6840547.1 hypothetical protein [Bacilli bacterium]